MKKVGQQVKKDWLSTTQMPKNQKKPENLTIYQNDEKL